VRQVFADLAPVLVTTTVVLAFGMLGSQFSAVPTIAYFGILCIVVFALALIAVLVVLPAVMLTRRGAPPIKETP
jgi:predicted RND superfamily exporter protein